jgi:hypothetical protein
MVREFGWEESSPETGQDHHGDREPTAQEAQNSGCDPVVLRACIPAPGIGEDLGERCRRRPLAGPGRGGPGDICQGLRCVGWVIVRSVWVLYLA